MGIGKAPKNWIRAAVIGVALGTSTVSAERPSPLETAGRLYGVCWGDGYHACASSGVRLGADLPPKSYAASYGSRSQVKPTAIVRRIRATYYDRFDAASARACDAPNCDSGQCDSGQCDSGQCDSGQCDSNPCDCGPVAAPYGSEVSQSVSAMRPSIAASQPSIPRQTVITPPVESQAGITPRPDPIIALTQPLTPQVKKYPTRPQPPVQLGRSNAIPVASKQQTFQFTAPENWKQATSNHPKHQPVRTTTPDTIDLIHPGSPPLVPARLSLQSNPIPSLTPSMATPAPIESDQPSKSEVASTPVPPPAFVPSYAITPYVSPAPIQAPAIQALTTTQAPATSQAPAASQAPTTDQRPARPARLGTLTAQAPKSAVAIKSVTDVKRPTRLGDGVTGPHARPFGGRPVVELAERTAEPSDGVIFQPNGSSLK